MVGAKEIISLKINVSRIAHICFGIHSSNLKLNKPYWRGGPVV